MLHACIRLAVGAAQAKAPARPMDACQNWPCTTYDTRYRKKRKYTTLYIGCVPSVDQLPRLEAQDFMIAWLRKSANIDESLPSKHCSLKQTLGCRND